MARFVKGIMCDVISVASFTQHTRRIINYMSEGLPAPWPNRDGYVHYEALFRQAVDLQVNLSGPIVPLSRKDFAAFIDRDVGNAADEPVAEVYPDEEDRTVTMLLDSKTAAVLLYAARLLFTKCEAHAREV